MQDEEGDFPLRSTEYFGHRRLAGDFNDLGGFQLEWRVGWQLRRGISVSGGEALRFHRRCNDTDSRPAQHKCVWRDRGFVIDLGVGEPGYFRALHVVNLSLQDHSVLRIDPQSLPDDSLGILEPHHVGGDSRH